MGRLLKALARTESDPRAVLAAVMEDCGERVSAHQRAAIARLPIEEDLEQLALWLLGVFEREPPPEDIAELRFRVVTSAWRGRVDSADLELEVTKEGVPARAGSAVLARLAQIVPFDPPRAARRQLEAEVALGEALALAFAAAAVRHLFERLDPALLLGGRAERAVSIAGAGRLLMLGHFQGEHWDRGKA